MSINLVLVEEEGVLSVGEILINMVLGLTSIRVILGLLIELF
jgi:hypothetical protein